MHGVDPLLPGGALPSCVILPFDPQSNLSKFWDDFDTLTIKDRYLRNQSSQAKDNHISISQTTLARWICSLIVQNPKCWLRSRTKERPQSQDWTDRGMGQIQIQEETLWGQLPRLRGDYKTVACTVGPNCCSESRRCQHIRPGYKNEAKTWEANSAHMNIVSSTSLTDFSSTVIVRISAAFDRWPWRKNKSGTRSKFNRTALLVETHLTYTLHRIMSYKYERSKT